MELLLFDFPEDNTVDLTIVKKSREKFDKFYDAMITAEPKANDESLKGLIQILTQEYLKTIKLTVNKDSNVIDKAEIIPLLFSLRESILFLIVLMYAKLETRIPTDKVPDGKTLTRNQWELIHSIKIEK